MRYMIISGAGLGALLLVACASDQLPRTEIASTMAEPRASIGAAREAGAANIPKAALHLQLATQQFEQGREAMQDERDYEAQRLFERAQADAELALEIARAHQAEQQEQEAQRRLLRVRGGERR